MNSGPAARPELVITACPHRHVAVTLNVMRSWRMWCLRDAAVIARSRPARIAGWTLAALLAAGRGDSLRPDAMASPRLDARHHTARPVQRAGSGHLGRRRQRPRHRVALHRPQHRLSRRGQVTDRFTVALERLGSSELYVRIGGVHALEHVMRDSAGHHNDVIEVLTEFIRDRAPCTARCRCARPRPLPGAAPASARSAGPAVIPGWSSTRPDAS